MKTAKQKYIAWLVKLMSEAAILPDDIKVEVVDENGVIDRLDISKIDGYYDRESNTYQLTIRNA